MSTALHLQRLSSSACSLQANLKLRLWSQVEILNRQPPSGLTRLSIVPLRCPTDCKMAYLPIGSQLP